MSNARAWFASLLLHTGLLYLVLAALALLITADHSVIPVLTGRLRLVTEIGLASIALGIAIHTRWRPETSRTPS